MGGEELYKDPEIQIASIFTSNNWRRINRRLWEKNGCRIYADEIGIFLYQLLDGRWVRTHGRSYNLMLNLFRPPSDTLLHFDDFTLDLSNPTPQ